MVMEVMFSDAGRMINKVNISAWRKEGWRASACGKMAQHARPHAFSSSFSGAMKVSRKPSCQGGLFSLFSFVLNLIP